MPKVSVLVPTYKPNTQHLSEMLESLMNQTEQDFECIICDEPTDTDCPAMIGEYLQNDRFRFYRNEKCLGIGGNWNRCFTYAKTPIIAYLFQDDLWEPSYVATGLKIFEENPNVGFISLNHRYQYDDDLWTIEGYEVLQKVKDTVLHEGVWKGKEFLTMWLKQAMYPNLIGEPPFVMIRREVMEKVGPFNEHMPQFLDVEYWLRCLLVTDWYYEKTIHGAFRVHGEGASFRNNESGQGLYDRLTCYQMLIDRLDGDMKELVFKSRKLAVEGMIKRFLMRVKRGKSMNSQGSAKVIRFVLFHPILVFVAFCKVLYRRLFQ